MRVLASLHTQHYFLSTVSEKGGTNALLRRSSRSRRAPSRILQHTQVVSSWPRLLISRPFHSCESVRPLRAKQDKSATETGLSRLRESAKACTQLLEGAAGRVCYSMPDILHRLEMVAKDLRCALRARCLDCLRVWFLGVRAGSGATEITVLTGLVMLCCTRALATVCHPQHRVCLPRGHVWVRACSMPAVRYLCEWQRNRTRIALRRLSIMIDADTSSEFVSVFINEVMFYIEVCRWVGSLFLLCHFVGLRAEKFIWWFRTLLEARSLCLEIFLRTFLQAASLCLKIFAKSLPKDPKHLVMRIGTD